MSEGAKFFCDCDLCKEIREKWIKQEIPKEPRLITEGELNGNNKINNSRNKRKSPELLV